MLLHDNLHYSELTHDVENESIAGSNTHPKLSKQEANNDNKTVIIASSIKSIDIRIKFSSEKMKETLKQIFMTQTRVNTPDSTCEKRLNRLRQNHTLSKYRKQNGVIIEAFDIMLKARIALAS